MMRVLMLGWELPPLATGGLGSACQGLSSALCEQGVDVVFLVPWAVRGQHVRGPTVVAALGEVDSVSPPGSVPATISLSYASAYTAKPDNALMTAALARYGEGARQLAADHAFDVLHAHDWTTFSAGMALQEALGKPLVAHFHSIERDRSPGKPSPEVCALEQQVLLRAERTISVSEYTRQQIADSYRVDLARLAVVHNGVDDAEEPPLVRPKAEKTRTALFVGRLTPQKGPQYFLLAAARVKEMDPSVRFVVVGDGEMRGYLEDMARKLGVADRVTFSGFLSRFDLERVYALADVCVMTSVSEPFGLVALEAIRHHVPVIVPRHSGVAEVIRNCVRVDYWDTESIAGEMVAVLNRDGAEGDAMAREAAEELKDLSWTRSARKVIGIYQELLSKGSKAQLGT